MITMAMLGKVRVMYYLDGKTISEIARLPSGAMHARSSGEAVPRFLSGSTIFESDCGGATCRKQL